MTDFLRIRSDDLIADISPYGAALARLWLKGHAPSLVLGLPTPQDYAHAPHAIGVIVGPLAGRITNAAVTFHGQTYTLPANARPHSLHSGPAGVQHRLWQTEHQTENTLNLRCDLPDGDCGLPGTRTLRATYSLDGTDLCLQIDSTSDADTYMNATSHAYWTLDGTGDLSAHSLMVAAREGIETGPDLTPTGRLTPLAGSAQDYTLPRCPVAGAPLDGTFCLNGTPALRLTSSRTGLALDVETNQPGLTLYTGAGLPARPSPPGTPPIRPFSALAIEAQGWPDAPNHAGFPSFLMRKGETLSQITCFRLRSA